MFYEKSKGRTLKVSIFHQARESVSTHTAFSHTCTLALSPPASYYKAEWRRGMAVCLLEWICQTTNVITHNYSIVIFLCCIWIYLAMWRRFSKSNMKWWHQDLRKPMAAMPECKTHQYYFITLLRHTNLSYNNKLLRFNNILLIQSYINVKSRSLYGCNVKLFKLRWNVSCNV